MTLAVFQGLAAQESSSDIVVLASPSVTVTNKATGGNPTVYQDRAGSTPYGSNPFTGGSDGSIEFYAPPGRYKVEATSGGSTVTWDNIIIGTLHGIDQPADGEFPEYDAGNDRWTARQSGYLDPEHATDGGTDAFASATNTSAPGTGVTIVRDFRSANTTTAPTLDGKTMTDRDGNALWGAAVSGVHDLQYASGTDTYLVLEPRPTSNAEFNSPVKRNAAGRIVATVFNSGLGNMELGIDEDDMASDSATAVPTQQSVKAYVDTEVAAGDPTLDTVVDATNGGANNLTEIDFTGIKSGAKRITVLFNDLSVSGADDVLIQIGDSGGFETSGYDANGGLVANGAATQVANSTAGFIIRLSSAAADLTGHMTLVLQDASANLWNSAHSGRWGSDRAITGGGDKSLSAELDRVRITTSGTDTFDGGNVNIMVE